jgi:phosphonate transport system substrate-binding protein
MDVPAAMVKRLTPLAQYLSSQTGYNVMFRASPDLDSAVEDLGLGRTQLAYLTPVAYIEAHEKYAAEPLVSPLTHGKSTFNLAIAVRKDSPIRAMRDMKGKTFAFGDEKALLQPAVVIRAGIKLEDFSSYAYLKHYDNIAKALLNGDFDAGILKDTIATKFEPLGLRVIHVSPPLASYLFATSNRLNPEAVAQLKAALLALNADTPENKAVLNAIDPAYDGFAVAEDRDYQGIRKLIAPLKGKN